MHSEIFRLGNHPSRHHKERDDAALLTQEGNSSAFPLRISCEGNLFGTAVPPHSRIHSWNGSVLSPMRSRGVLNSPATPSHTFAIGVHSGAMMKRLPFICPPAPPIIENGNG